MSDTYSMIRFTAENTLKFINNTRYKVFGYGVSVMERIGKLFWHLETISSLQEFKTHDNACYSLVLVCKDFIHEHGRTRNKHLFQLQVSLL